MLDKLKLALAGWSLRTFVGKYMRRGVRVGVSFLLGKALAPAALIKVNAIAAAVGYTGTIEPVAVALVVEGIVWTKLEAAANILKVQAERSDRWRWLGAML